jgi:chorismate mutase/prephenate dehydratase
MPSSIPIADSAPDLSLAELRAQLDRLDDAIHDLLMQRAEVVSRVARLAQQGKVAFRPGREADIIRRLLARHSGPLPRRVLPRLWRELFAATTSMQGLFTIAVCQPEPAAGYIACAREHFGALTPLRVHSSPAGAIAEVVAGSATAAVLPLPREDEPPASAWWTTLLHREDARVQVVARLPFWLPRPEGAPHVQALVVAAAPPDLSRQDRTLLGFDLPPEMSRARLSAACTAVGLTLSAMILRRDATAQTAQALVEVDGYVTEEDPRLARLAENAARPVVLGAYAVPVDGEPP